MAAYAEGLNILAGANVGAAKHDVDAETSPLERPDLYQYDFDLAEVAEVWRRGCGRVVLAARPHRARRSLGDPGLGAFQGRVSDSGEGRWTLTAAIDEGVPAPVLATALFNRFSSRGDDDFANRILVRHAPRVRRARREARRRRGRGCRYVERAPHRSGRRLRCAGLLRRHGRPRLQADLPGAVRDGPPRRPRRPRHRRRQGRVDPRAAARAAPSPAWTSTASTTPPSSRSSPRCCATSTATTPTRPPSSRCARSSATRSGPSTTSPSRPPSSARWSARSAAPAAPTTRASCVEKPFGRDAASAAELEPHAAGGLPRVLHLPHRPLPRQGAGAEPALLPLRATPSSSPSGTATTCAACRSPWPRTSASPSRGAFYDHVPAPSATSCRTTCSRSSPCWPWRHRRTSTTRPSATPRPCCSRPSGRSTPATSCAASTPATPASPA